MDNFVGGVLVCCFVVFWVCFGCVVVVASVSSMFFSSLTFDVAIL